MVGVCGSGEVRCNRGFGGDLEEREAGRRMDRCRRTNEDEIV